MTKKELLQIIKDCSDDARITVVDDHHYVHDAIVYFAKAKEGFRKTDEVFLEAIK
jgi:hypothetical protein